MPVSSRFVLGLLVLLPACDGPVSPAPDPANLFPRALQQAAFLLEIHTDGRATVLAEAGEAPASVPLLDGTVAQVEVVAVDAGLAGEVEPGWRRVRVQLRVRNTTRAASLVAPHFDVATPADCLLLIPLESWAPPSDGDISVNDGTEVTIELPNHGAVRPAETWNGPPKAFFSRASGCSTVDTSCRPYEPVPVPLAPGAGSEVQQLAFEVETTVHVFRFRLLLAGATQ